MWKMSSQCDRVSARRCLMSTTHAANLMTVRGTYSMDVLRYTCQSSAYMWRRRPCERRSAPTRRSKAHAAVGRAPTLAARRTVRTMSATEVRDLRLSARNERELYSSYWIQLSVSAAGCGRRSRKPLRGPASRAVSPPAHQPMSVSWQYVRPDA